MAERRPATDEVIALRAKGLIAFCIQAYLGSFLAMGEDAVKAIHYPGDPALALNEQRRLSLGVIREMVILRHFPNLHSFWACHDRQDLKFLDELSTIEPNLINRLLNDDQEALAMLKILEEVSFEPGSLYVYASEFNEYRKLFISGQSSPTTSIGMNPNSFNPAAMINLRRISAHRDKSRLTSDGPVKLNYI